jgi:hypothetical protein
VSHSRVINRNMASHDPRALRYEAIDSGEQQARSKALVAVTREDVFIDQEGLTLCGQNTSFNITNDSRPDEKHVHAAIGILHVHTRSRNSWSSAERGQITSGQIVLIGVPDTPSVDTCDRSGMGQPRALDAEAGGHVAEMLLRYRHRHGSSYSCHPCANQWV